MSNSSIAGTSVTQHLSSRQVTKENNVTGIIANYQIVF